jgi:ectoine hydroxylase-related dioxygenase (phytanoyl-CoA dioxygenase family)
MAGLEKHHSTILGRFPDPDVAGVGEHFQLTAAQREQFQRDGFVAEIDLLDAAVVGELRDRLEYLGRHLHEFAGQLYEIEAAWYERAEEVVLHFLGAWLIDELIHDLVFHPGVTVPVAQVLGAKRLRFFHDQVFWKPARHPGVVPWHQDYSYWTRTGPPAHASLFLTLDDMGPENGGLEYVPGSHRWGLFPLQSFGGPLDALQEHLNPEQCAQFRPQCLRLRAGQASIHHSHLIHGSRGNTSDQPRRGLVLNYMADGTLVLDDSRPLLRGVAHLEKGDRVAGAHFPLIRMNHPL